MSAITDLIWDNLLEGAPGVGDEAIKQLTCGCLVLCDGDYLDLFIWNGASGACDQEYAHDVILAYRPFAELGDASDYSAEEAEQLLAAVSGYTDGWGDVQEEALALFRAALPRGSDV